METMTIKAEARTTKGTRQARRLREQGKLPAIIYGHGVEIWKETQLYCKS